jgi:hypothetical protein
MISKMSRRQRILISINNPALFPESSMNISISFSTDQAILNCIGNKRQ